MAAIPTTHPHPLAAEPGAKPVSPNLAPWSAEQTENWNRIQEHRRRIIGPPAEHPAETQRRQAEETAAREAREAAERAAAGDPRQRLRNAHAALNAAQEDVARRREAVVRAKSYLDGVQADHAEAVRVQTQVRNAAAQRLKSAIEAGGAVTTSPVSDGATGGEVERLAHDLAVAETAHVQLIADVRSAERAVEQAQRSVGEAAQAVIVDDARGRGFRAACSRP